MARPRYCPATSTLCKIVAVLSIIYLLQSTVALPISSSSTRKTRQSDDNFGFPDDVKTVTDRVNNSCYVNVTIQYRVLQPDNTYIVNETITTRNCCQGYSGVECNILSDPYLASSPCRDKTCPNDPDAVCAVVSRCGVEVPVFLDEDGQIVDCDDEDETNITTLSCTGYCSVDPCAGLTCEKYPSAICLTIGCACEPIWLLEDGVSVNCTTGNVIQPDTLLRNRRQVQVELSDSTEKITSCSR